MAQIAGRRRPKAKGEAIVIYILDTDILTFTELVSQSEEFQKNPRFASRRPGQTVTRDQRLVPRDPKQIVSEAE
jgi:hypothetical protein